MNKEGECSHRHISFGIYLNHNSVANIQPPLYKVSIDLPPCQERIRGRQNRCVKDPPNYIVQEHGGALSQLHSSITSDDYSQAAIEVIARREDFFFFFRQGNSPL